MAQHVCPIWVGYLLASPLRRLSQKPEKILNPYIKPGMTVIDIGCAMGFFSLPTARMVGPDGRVVCVDVQPRMINSLRRRATRAGLIERMDLRACPEDSLGVDDLAGKIDFVLAIAVAHEVPDVPGLMTQIRDLLNPQGRCLLAEPSGHINADEFAKTVALAEKAGLKIIDRPKTKRSRAVLLERS